jgi:hypothetical protein
MSDPTLQQLEREVEVARAKLVGDLATLRSPATFSQFTSDLKHEALDIKDDLVDKAKASVQSTFEGLIDDVKARAAANPAAALAIGAGVAWRLIKHPPIATALVGAGLYSLFRTSPTPFNSAERKDYLTQAKIRLGEQTTDFAETVTERVLEMGGAAAEKASELAAHVRDRASAMGETATGKAAEIAGSVKESARQWSDEMRSSARQIGAEVSNDAAHTISRVGAAADEWASPLQRTMEDPEARDKLLLGAAGVAVIAALGIACQRRLRESADID